MILKIEFSAEARNDLRQIREYISIDLGNEQSARDTLIKAKRNKFRPVSSCV